jgi:hypothetical protein
MGTAGTNQRCCEERLEEVTTTIVHAGCPKQLTTRATLSFEDFPGNVKSR